MGSVLMKFASFSFTGSSSVSCCRPCPASIACFTAAAACGREWRNVHCLNCIIREAYSQPDPYSACSRCRHSQEAGTTQQASAVSKGTYLLHHIEGRLRQAAGGGGGRSRRGRGAAAAPPITPRPVSTVGDTVGGGGDMPQCPRLRPAHRAAANPGRAAPCLHRAARLSGTGEGGQEHGTPAAGFPASAAQRSKE